MSGVFYVYYLLVLIPLFSVFFFRKQLLVSLLSLEFVNLMMFMLLLIFLGIMNQPISFSFFFLILGACEASLGLSLLVIMTRFKGNDMLSGLSMYKC